MVELFQTLFVSVAFGIAAFTAVAAIFSQNFTYTVNGVKQPVGLFGRILMTVWCAWCAYIWYTLL